MSGTLPEDNMDVGTLIVDMNGNLLDAKQLCGLINRIPAQMGNTTVAKFLQALAFYRCQQQHDLTSHRAPRWTECYQQLELLTSIITPMEGIMGFYLYNCLFISGVNAHRCDKELQAVYMKASDAFSAHSQGVVRLMEILCV